MSDEPKSKRLKFKGEKTKKKRRRDDDDNAGGSKRKRVNEEEEGDEEWVLPDDPLQIRGPTFIMHPSDPLPVCINFDATRNRIILHSLDKDKEAETTETTTLLSRTPFDISQVWVTTRIAGSPTINLRTGAGEGKFLSCDAHGLVTADREARGPQEEWTPVILPDGMCAFMNVYEKYLAVDETAGGTLTLRGDSDEVGFRERFWAKIQGKYKREVEGEEKKKKEGEKVLDIDESGTNHIYQAWGAGRSVVSDTDKKELKRARKEGRLAEAMLDRRAKLKSDRFC